MNGLLHCRPDRRLLAICVAVCGLVFLGLTPAYAGFSGQFTKNTGPVVTTSGNTHTINWDDMGSVNGAVDAIMSDATGILVEGTANIGDGRGRSVAVKAAQRVPWSAVARGLGPIGTVYGAWEVSTAVWDWYNDAKVKPVPCPNDGSKCDGATQWQVMSGETVQTSYVWRIESWHNLGLFGSISSACSAWYSAANASDGAYYQSQGMTYTPTGLSVSTSPVPHGSCTRTATWSRPNGQSGTISGAATLTRLADVWCVDSGTGQTVTRPTGGVCPGGVFEPAPGGWPDVLPKLGNNPPQADGGPDPGPPIWDDIIGKQPQGGGIPAPQGTPQVSGPSSSPGPSSTTTGPGGTTTTTITNNYNYNNNTVTVTTTTTVTAPDGTTTTTESEPPPEAPTNCEKNPDTLGCAQLGTVPDIEIPTAERAVSWDPEAVGLPAGCPAPRNGPRDIVITYDAACQFADGVRPFVIAAAAFCGLLIVIGSLKP